MQYITGTWNGIKGVTVIILNIPVANILLPEQIQDETVPIRIDKNFI